MKLFIDNAQVSCNLPIGQQSRINLLVGLFSRLDADGSGSLDFDEVFEFLALIIDNLNKETFLTIWASMDIDNSGEMSLEEFVFWFELCQSLNQSDIYSMSLDNMRYLMSKLSSDSKPEEKNEEKRKEKGEREEEKKGIPQHQHGPPSQKSKKSSSSGETLLKVASLAVSVAGLFLGVV